MNVSVPEVDSRNRMKAYGLSLDTQVNILQSMSKTIENLRVKGKKTMLPFQKGKNKNSTYKNVLFT